MRPLSLLALLALLPAASALAQTRLVESSATLSLILAHQGEASERPLRNDGVLQVAPLEYFRLGNREILETMVAEELIDSIQGWRVVGLWANWLDEAPYAGNAYRFFARRGSGDSLQHVAIPASLLSIEPFMAAAGIRHTRDSAGNLVAGTETAALFEEVNFDLGGHAGLLHGHTTGGGRYLKLKDEDEARYFIPGASKSTLAGTYTDDGEVAAGVVSGTLKFSAAKMITLPVVSSGGSSGSTGGVIIIGGPGPILNPIDTDIPVLVNGDISLGGSGTVTTTLINGVLSPGSTATLTFSNGGTLTLGTGEVLTFAPGESIHLATLTGEQLTGASFQPLTPPDPAP